MNSHVKTSENCIECAMRQLATKKIEDDKRVEISGSSSNNNEKLYYKTENNWKSALRKMKLSEMKNNESTNKSIKHIKSTTHTTIKMKVKKNVTKKE